MDADFLCLCRLWEKETFPEFAAEKERKKKKNKRILGKNTTDHILPHQYQTKKGEKENLTALRRYYENQSLFFPKISFQND